MSNIRIESKNGRRSIYVDGVRVPHVKRVELTIEANGSLDVRVTLAANNAALQVDGDNAEIVFDEPGRHEHAWIDSTTWEDAVHDLSRYECRCGIEKVEKRP